MRCNFRAGTDADSLRIANVVQATELDAPFDLREIRQSMQILLNNSVEFDAPQTTNCLKQHFLWFLVFRARSFALMHTAGPNELGSNNGLVQRVQVRESMRDVQSNLHFVSAKLHRVLRFVKLFQE